MASRISDSSGETVPPVVGTTEKIIGMSSSKPARTSAAALRRS